MDYSVARSLRPFLDRTRQRAPLSPVLTLKASSMQRIMQMMQKALQKSCITAFKFMCFPLDSLLCDRIIYYPVPVQQPKENQTEQEVLQGPPSTIMVINITNSTLTDCVIGNDAYMSAVAVRQPLMLHPQRPVHGQGTCSCSHEQQEEEQSTPPFPPPSCSPPLEEQLNISIEGSQLNYVIIGDNSYMHAEQNTSFE